MIADLIERDGARSMVKEHACFVRRLRLPVAVVQLDHFLYKLLVARVQVQVGAVNVHPSHVLSVVTCFEREVLEDVIVLVMEIVGDRLHPSVVRVARVIHVAAVELGNKGRKKLAKILYFRVPQEGVISAYFCSIFEQSMQLVLNLLLRLLVLGQTVGGFFHELSLESGRYLLTWIAHALEQFKQV